MPGASTMPGRSGKDKGKEVVHGNAVAIGDTPADMDSGDRGDFDDDDVKGGKKKKNIYKHLIKGIPGVLLTVDLVTLAISNFF